jgi:hypothetical protein
MTLMLSATAAKAKPIASSPHDYRAAANVSVTYDNRSHPHTLHATFRDESSIVTTKREQICLSRKLF